MSDLIHPYAALAGDPTTEALICWVDVRPTADGSAQSLAYGEDLGTSATVVAAAAANRASAGVDLWRYAAALSGLTPGTLYECEVRDAEGEPTASLPPFRTLPATVPDGGLRLGWYSDSHAQEEGEPDPPGWGGRDDIMVPLGQAGVDLVVIGGDVVSYGDSPSATRISAWTRWLRECVGRLHAEAGRMVPLVVAPGNHDVGNHNWTGDPAEETVLPSRGYLQHLNLTPHWLAPSGENYGSIKIGDYLQLLVLDTHGAFADDVAPWMEGVIDDGYPLCLPVHHAPLMPGGARNNEHNTFFPRLRALFGPVFAAHRNIKVTLCGHIHVRKMSVPYTVSPSPPAAPHFDLSQAVAGAEGYLHARAGGVVEIGDGWPMARTPWDRWWLQYADELEHQVFVLTVTEGALTVSLRDHEGAEWRAEVFPLAPPEVPAPPSGLAASRQGAGYVASWEPSEWARGYNVYGRSGGAWELLQTVYIEGAYSASERPAEVAISAFNELGEGALSAAVSLAVGGGVAYHLGGVSYPQADDVVHLGGVSYPVRREVVHLGGASYTVYEA